MEELVEGIDKQAGEVLEAMEREGKNEAGPSLVRSSVPTPVLVSALQKYKLLTSRIQDQLTTAIKMLDKSGKTEGGNSELEEAKKELKSLLSDTAETRMAELDAHVCQRRLAATEALLTGAAEKDPCGAKDEKCDLAGEKREIEALHGEIREGIVRACETEIGTQFAGYTEQLAGNDIIALLPSVLGKVEELLNKHIVSLLISATCV